MMQRSQDVRANGGGDFSPQRSAYEDSVSCSHSDEGVMSILWFAAVTLYFFFPLIAVAMFSFSFRFLPCGCGEKENTWMKDTATKDTDKEKYAA